MTGQEQRAPFPDATSFLRDLRTAADVARQIRDEATAATAAGEPQPRIGVRVLADWCVALERAGEAPDTRRPQEIHGVLVNDVPDLVASVMRISEELDIDMQDDGWADEIIAQVAGARPARLREDLERVRQDNLRLERQVRLLDEQARRAVPDTGRPAVQRHRMLPGSHERPGGAECSCGAAWDRWGETCVAAAVPSPDTGQPADEQNAEDRA